MSRRVNPRRSRSGFTLIEMLVVIMIIATLASVVAPAVFGHVSDARQAAAKTQIEVFALALDSYKLDNASYPTTEQGLNALRAAPSAGEAPSNWRGPYLKKAIPLDPWGRPYVLVSPGVANPDSYDLYSLGKDGVIGGDREDMDITSWGGPAQR